MTDWKKKYEDLVRQLENVNDGGIYPMGHMPREERDGDEIKKTDAYKCGWNDAVMKQTEIVSDLVERAGQGVSDDVTMLLASGHCFLEEDGTLSLNMNDTWAWALAWCPGVGIDELAEVARLFKSYGNAGLMYWHSCQEKDMRSEFHDNNRAIDFVRHEETIRKETPNSSKRAYRQLSYLIGVGPTHENKRSWWRFWP